jgi:hypothetical protein
MTTNSAGRYFRAGTSGQFKPGYYRRHLPGSEVAYTSTDEEGFGAILAVWPATEETIGKYGFHDDNDPRNDPDFYDADGGSNFPSPDDPADYEDGPVQGEMFRQTKGSAHNLFANIESRSRTLTLLGIAARDQERNFGPATVSSSLTPDSFGMLKHIEEVEQGKNKKTVAWEPGYTPEEPELGVGLMRPVANQGVHSQGEGSTHNFPNQMLEVDEVDYNLASPQQSGLTQFTEAEVQGGKQFVRDQWVRSRGKKDKARPSRQLNRQQELFPEEANP